MLKSEQWKKILDAANSNKGDILEAIKEKLKKQDKDTYQVWERNDFDVNHPFSVLFDINSDQHNYSTLLNLAVTNDHLKIVKYLVDNTNVNLDQKNNYGKTPLHYATLASSLKIVKALLENGADINAKDNNGTTPLHWATFNHRVEIIKALLENGADINAKDNNGTTPLHYAVRYGEYDMCYDGVKFLIAHEVELKGSKAQKPEYLVQYGSNFIKEMSEYWDKRLEMEKMKLDQGKHKKFSICANEIESQYPKLEERLGLLTEGSKILRGIFSYDKKISKELYDLPSEKVAGFLSNAEIENLNEAVRGQHA